MDRLEPLALSLGVLLLLAGCGLGLASLLASRSTRGAWLLLGPGIGLWLVTSVQTTLSALGWTARPALSVIASAALALGLAGWWKGRKLRLPSRAETAVLLAALPAVLLTNAPLAFSPGSGPASYGNCDPVLHAMTATHLMKTPSNRAADLDSAHPLDRLPYEKIQRSERLGFEFALAIFAIVFDRHAFEMIGPLVASGFYLASVSVGLFCLLGLRLGWRRSAFATALFACSSFPMWTVFGGYGPQVLSFHLSIGAFALLVAAVSCRDGKTLAVAAVFLAALISIYVESLPYPATAFALFVLVSFRDEPAAGIRSAGMGLGAGILALALNPVAALEIAGRMEFLLTTPSAGNVGGFVDPREILGIVPPGRWVSLPDYALLQIAWLPAVFILALCVRGWLSSSGQSRVVLGCYLAPVVGTALWFRFSDYPYGYFKAWSLGAFLIPILLTCGIFASHQWAGHRRRRLRDFMAAGMLVTLLLSSLVLVHQAATRTEFPSEAGAIRSWLESVPPGASIFVETGAAAPTTAFWVAHILHSRPTAFAQDLCYARTASQRADERYLVRYSGAGSGEVISAKEPAVVQRVGTWELIGPVGSVNQ